MQGGRRRPRHAPAEPEEAAGPGGTVLGSERVLPHRGGSALPAPQAFAWISPATSPSSSPCDAWSSPIRSRFERRGGLYRGVGVVWAGGARLRAAAVRGAAEPTGGATCPVDQPDASGTDVGLAVLALAPLLRLQPRRRHAQRGRGPPGGQSVCTLPRPGRCRQTGPRTLLVLLAPPPHPQASGAPHRPRATVRFAAGCYERPPSTTRTWPEIHAACSLARKRTAAATSSAVPRRRTWMESRIRRFTVSS